VDKHCGVMLQFIFLMLHDDKINDSKTHIFVVNSNSTYRFMNKYFLFVVMLIIHQFLVAINFDQKFDFKIFP